MSPLKLAHYRVLLWVLGLFIVLSASSLQAGVEQNAGALVLVNSQAMDYSDFQQILEPYLQQFGVPFEVQDIAQKPLTNQIGEFALIIIGHRGLDVPRRFLTLEAEQLLQAAIGQGSGLVSFDGLLTAWEGKEPRRPYPLLDEIFDVGAMPVVNAESVVVGLPQGTDEPPLGVRYIIDAGPIPRTITLKRPIGLPGVRTGSRSHILATAGGQPLLICATAGKGQAVLFTSYEWVKPDVKGRLYGLDDLVWRSLAWAARKPFVMRGMPHFLAFRVDDVSGFGIRANQHLGWVLTANRFGLKPWLGLFIDDLREDPQALKMLAQLTSSGQATASVHARRWRSFFYLEEPLLIDDQGRNIAGRPWPDLKMQENYIEGHAFLAENGIVNSKVTLPHFYESAPNNFVGLKKQGTEFTGTVLEPGLGYGSLMPVSGPYLNSEPPRPSNGKDPVFIADWLKIPGHPELDRQFFNFVVEVRDVAGYEWAPSGVSVEEAIRRGIEETKREWDSLLPGVLFTHESDHIQHIGPEDWERILQGVMEGLKANHPEPVTLDYLCQYMRALKTSRIASAHYSPGTQMLEVGLDGDADLPTRGFVFLSLDGMLREMPFRVSTFFGGTVVKLRLKVAGPFIGVENVDNRY